MKRGSERQIALTPSRNWWAHKNSNLGPADYSTTTAFAAPFGFVARTIPSPYPGGRRWVPSSLYTFPLRGLDGDCHRPWTEGFPEFDTLSPRRFQRGLPIESQLLYQLSYAPLVISSFKSHQNSIKKGLEHRVIML